MKMVARSGGITVKFWTSVSMLGSCWSFLETSDEVVEWRSSLTSMIFKSIGRSCESLKLLNDFDVVNDFSTYVVDLGMMVFRLSEM